MIGKQLGVDEGIVGQVCLSGEPVIVSDYHDFPENSEPGHAETRAGGSAPIKYGGEVRGAISVGTTDPLRAFGRAELDSLRRLADLGSVALEQAEMRKHLELAVGSGVEALTEAIDMRDHYTWQHSQNVMELAGKLGKRMELDEAALAELAFAARLHDVGKVGVPDSVLLKADMLNDDEWEIMKQYPLRGAEMLERVPGLGNVAQLVLSEHEHWDGSGYPQGLKGEDIPLAQPHHLGLRRLRRDDVGPPLARRAQALGRGARAARRRGPRVRPAVRRPADRRAARVARIDGVRDAARRPPSPERLSAPPEPSVMKRPSS